MKAEFETAAAEVQKLSSRPDNDTLLKLYSFYKQATEGDVRGSRPGMLDLKGRKKYDAWASIQGMAKETAMKEYVALVRKLQGR